MSLSSATQHAMPLEFGRKWGTECLNTRVPLPTLLCEGYSVKLIYFRYILLSIYLIFVYYNTSGRARLRPLIWTLRGEF